MSLISASRSLPDAWIVFADSTWRMLRLPSAFFASLSDKSSKLFSGVRSSCDMFARNSDLYFDVSASCFAFSSSAWRACSTSRVLALDLLVLVRELARLFLERLVRLLQLLGERLRLLQQVSPFSCSPRSC